MPLFRYTVIDPSGKRITQSMTAGSKREVAAYLAKNDYFIVDINEKSGKKTGRTKEIASKDKIFFTQNISVLLASGVSLGEAISIIAEDANSKTMTLFCATLQDELERGLPLSKALAHYPESFDPVYISLVTAGENSGQLDQIMSNLAKSMQKDVRTVQQVKSALLYPVFVLASLLVLGVLILFFVLPKIATIFEQLNAKLPLATRLLIRLSKFATHQPIILITIFVLLIVAGFFLLRWRKAQQFLGAMVIRLPLVKQIILHLDLSRLSSTLALLLNAGVPIQEAIRIAAGTVKNPKLSQEFQDSTQKLASGRGLAQVLHEVSLPKTFISLVAVGERSGNIATIFSSLAEHYEDLLDAAIKDFTAILEPVLTLFVGLIVAGAIVTIMLPLYQFIGQLDAGGA